MGIPVNMTETELLTELGALNQEYHRLNRRIELAVLRQRFSAAADEVERARTEERIYVQQLDRAMTRLRAVESHLKAAREEAPRVLH